MRCLGRTEALDRYRLTAVMLRLTEDVAMCGGVTSRAPVTVGGSEASPAIRSAIASPKRE